MCSCSSLRIKSTPSPASILGVTIFTLGSDKLRVRDKDYEITPGIYKVLSYTGYTGKTRKNENDTLMMNNNINDLGYTGFGDRNSKSKTFFTIRLPKLVEEIQN